MIASSRTVRLMAASMAVLLLVGGSLPLVQHVCAMAIERAETDDHDLHGKTAAHHGMHDHGAMHAPPQDRPPCSHDEQRPAAPRDCCAIQTTPGVVAPSVAAKRLPTSMAAVAVPVLLAPRCADASQPAFLFDTGPPPSPPLRLHLLHASFLT